MSLIDNGIYTFFGWLRASPFFAYFDKIGSSLGLSHYVIKNGVIKNGKSDVSRDNMDGA